MKDIVERLEKEARNLSVVLTCECNSGLHDDSCEKCRPIKLLWEAAQEIKELKDLLKIADTG